MIFPTTFALVFAVLWGVFLVAEPAMSGLLKRTAHWTTKFRYHDYLPVLIVLAIGIAAAAMAGDAFIDLAERVHAGSPKLHHIDQETHDWARYTRTPGSTRFFTTMTIIGTPAFLGAVVLIVTILLVVKKHWRWAVFLAFTTGVGSLLNVELKRFFARARPDLAEALRRASGYSFPSGHAMGSTIVLTALAMARGRAGARVDAHPRHRLLPHLPRRPLDLRRRRRPRGRPDLGDDEHRRVRDVPADPEDSGDAGESNVLTERRHPAGVLSRLEAGAPGKTNYPRSSARTSRGA